MTGNSEYLPYNFWYHGMNKIKAGKGYRNGIPLGVISGPCDDCGHDTISIKINTSRKGFETTTERVCPICGLVHQGPFQVLDRYNVDYTSYEMTHQQWIDQIAKGERTITHQGKPIITVNKRHVEDVDYDVHHEYNMQEAGTRSGLIYSPSQYNIYGASNKRLAKAIKRLAKTKASIKQPMQQWRLNEYHKIADDYIHMLELNKSEGADVHWHIDTHGVTQLTRYGKANVDDVIYHLCILYSKIDRRKCTEYNKYLYDLLRDRYPR